MTMEVGGAAGRQGTPALFLVASACVLRAVPGVGAGMTALYGLAVRDGGGGGARAALDYCAGAADAQAGVGVFVNLR